MSAPVRPLVAALVTAVALVACAPSRGPTPPVVERMTADRPAPPTDVVEVWVCDVPLDTTAGLYGDLPLRLELDPGTVAASLAPGLVDYFATVSFGAYRPSFVAGGTVTMSADDTDVECVDEALDRASDDTTVVLAVATAEHDTGRPGGWGTPGSWLSCEGTCPASATRRSAYVGASDFSPDWGPVPLLDLVQHELGHALGLPHSGTDVPGGAVYLSALDVMSNSAAPREIDETRLDGPDVLAIARLDLGWLGIDDVTVADHAGTTSVRLAASAAPAGERLLVLPVDEHRIVTVELLVPEGLNDHLPEAGLAIHLVDDSAGTDVGRSQQPQGSSPPFTDLLGPGGSLTVSGWRIEVRALEAGPTGVASVEVAVGATGR